MKLNGQLGWSTKQLSIHVGPTSTVSTNFHVGTDGHCLMPNNNYVPLVSNLLFDQVTHAADNDFGACGQCNRSKCFNLQVDGVAKWPEQLQPQIFGCKKSAATMFGKVDLPWGVCIPLDAPVNLRPDYPNWGPVTGSFGSLVECQNACK